MSVIGVLRLKDVLSADEYDVVRTTLHDGTEPRSPVVCRGIPITYVTERWADIQLHARVYDVNVKPMKLMLQEYEQKGVSLVTLD